MTKNLRIALYLFKKLFKGKIRNWKGTDLAIVVLFILGLAYSLRSFYPIILQFNQPLIISSTSLLIGIIIGVFISFSQYDSEEVSFLYLTTYKVSIITWYYILKLAMPIILISIILFGSLIFYSNYLGRIFEYQTEVILGGFLGPYIFLTFHLDKKWKLIHLAGTLLIVITSLLEGHLGIKIIASFLFSFFFYWCSKKSWEKRLYEINKFKRKKRGTILSGNPIIKKELILLFNPQRIVPLTILLVVGQIGFLLESKLPFNVILLVTLILVTLMHDAWTLNIIGLEESTIYLYKYTGVSSKKLIVKKWFICFSLVFLFGLSIYLFWSIYYNLSVVDITNDIFQLVMFNFVISIIYIFIGLKFSDFNSRTYYRINMVGVIISGISMLSVFGSLLISGKLLLIEAIILGIIFVRVFYHEKTVRSVLYV
ncbi:hypothetical protein MHI02_07775 [Oceanobacillus sp. FSL K6-0118]|uniref:hypothetical protein n=1 Tax=Oceanobacillus sp. FSL K6-0118 TaxID=2921418 RepID=UPI0030F7A670